MYKSERGFPLLCQQAIGVPVVTLENYEKWYHIYVIQPNGIVEIVDPGLVVELASKETLLIDHEFHPKLLLLIAQKIGGSVHPVSLEVAAGRWIMSDHSLCVEMSYFLNED